MLNSFGSRIKLNNSVILRNMCSLYSTPLKNELKTVKFGYNPFWDIQSPTKLSGH